MNEEEKEAVRQALLQWKSEGVEHPVIPVYTDLDGDGVFDSYGLSRDDQLIIVSGVALADTVSVSDSDGEVPGNE